MLIYLCLSSHGYGHAARQASIISELYRIEPNYRYVISSAINISFLKILFRGIPVEYRKLRWDIGIVQNNALDADLESTLICLNKLNNDLPKQIQLEADWILAQNQKVLILSDIPPSAAELANRIGCKLIWMANFGWDDIYKPFGGDFDLFADKATKEYERGDALIRFPFSLDMQWNITEYKVGITSSNPKPLHIDFLSKIKSHDKDIVMISFGGLGYDLSFDLFSKWPNYIFLLPHPLDNLGIKYPSNVYSLPKSARVLDALPYCTRHITKPGYSTFCEAINCGIGLHIIPRKNFIESENLINGIKHYGYHRILEKSLFDQGNWELDEQLYKPKEIGLPNNGSLRTAKIILDISNQI